MTAKLYAHPFSSYCQKVLIALYENATPFEFCMLESENSMRELERLWPIKQFPVLVDAGRTLAEATTIIEYLEVHHPGQHAFIPRDAAAAIDVRFMDRFFDNYISTPQQKIVFDRRRDEDDRDGYGVAEARVRLDTAYAWLDERMRERKWACGEHATLADCAAAPALFYADWTHAIDGAFKHVRAYRDRLLAWPAFARAVDEARPYRKYFPLGAPDRD